MQSSSFQPTFFLLLLLLLVAFAAVQAFVAPSLRPSSSPVVMRSSRRSSTTPVMVGWFGAATKPKPPTGQAAKEEAARLKGELYRITKGKDNGLKASEAETKQVLDLAERLNKLNQVKGIARSTGVDGTWKLLFTTTKGGSSGKLGPFVGEVLQKIDTGSGYYVNFVRLFGGAVEGALEATWEVTGQNEWKVIFQNITFKLLGIPAVDKKPLPNQAGVWRLTYLDEDLRILYAAGLTNEGKPAKVSNIYILKRV